MAATQPLLNRRLITDWLGIAPFAIFAVMFLIAPTVYLVSGAFLDPDGNLTLRNIVDLFQPNILAAYIISIKVSAASAMAARSSALRLPPRSRWVACPPGCARRC